MKRSRRQAALVVLLVLLLVTSTVAVVYGRADPGVLPPSSRVQGLTYGDWLAMWWQYALELPASENPLVGATGANCVYERIGNVALVIADTQVGESIQCEVPAGTMLFLEVLSAECSTDEPPPFYGGNEEELRACAQAFVPENLEASLDGAEIEGIGQYIVTSPIYDFMNPEDNILGVPPGTPGQSVAYGAHLLLAPLSPGTHTIHLHGEYLDLPWIADKVLNLSVVQGR